jgi:hypothetical protein
MVVKEVLMDNMRDPKDRRIRLPRETRIHQLVEDRKADVPDMCRYLVRFLGHRQFMRRRRYRIYLERYEAGDLYHAMSDHFEHAAGNLLPVQFIWYMVKALATACLVFENVTIDETPMEVWKPIRHLDLVLGMYSWGSANESGTMQEKRKDKEMEMVKGEGSKQQGQLRTSQRQAKTMRATTLKTTGPTRTHPTKIGLTSTGRYNECTTKLKQVLIPFKIHPSFLF